MYLSYLELFDLFLRFIAIGQLSLLSFYVLAKSCNLTSVLATTTSVCLSAYLLLTAPIADQHYGVLRGVLLFFTELAPYLLWCFAVLLLRDNFILKKWSFGIKTGITLALLWFLYFFGYQQGRGAFHQINHLLQLLPLCHIIFIAVKDLKDDLVNARRNIRLILVMSISLYFIFILVLELGDSSVRASSIFSSINAFLVLMSTSVFTYFVFKGKFKEETLKIAEGGDQKQEDAIPLVYKDLNQRLRCLMEEKFFMETQLTIKELAEKLTTPEHQLRELINKHLGFRNFSDFLNSYRLPMACSQLKDIANLRKPILTIALELGYGSIATFNRAFKAKMAQTPKEYRSKFQK